MRLNDLLLGIAVMCLWGFNFSVIKLGVNHIDPILLVALRFTLATIPVVFFVTRPRVPAGYFFAYGLTFGTGVWGMMTWSIAAGVSAGMAGLLMQLSLVSSLVLGWAWLKEKLAMPKLIGAALALAGLGVSMTLQDGSVSWVGLALTLVAAVSWSLTGIIVKKAGTTEIFAFSVWGMLFAPIPLVLMAWLAHGSEVFIALPGQLNRDVWFSVLFQAYPTTLLGYWLWNRLIVKYPLSSVAPLTLLVPVFGLLGSYLFYSESISVTKLFACFLILTGLLISQWRPGWGRKGLVRQGQ